MGETMFITKLFNLLTSNTDDPVYWTGQGHHITFNIQLFTERYLGGRDVDFPLDNFDSFRIQLHAYGFIRIGVTNSTETFRCPRDQTERYSQSGIADINVLVPRGEFVQRVDFQDSSGSGTGDDEMLVCEPGPIQVFHYPGASAGAARSNAAQSSSPGSASSPDNLQGPQLGSAIWSNVTESYLPGNYRLSEPDEPIYRDVNLGQGLEDSPEPQRPNCSHLYSSPEAETEPGTSSTPSTVLGEAMEIELGSHEDMQFATASEESFGTELPPFMAFTPPKEVMSATDEVPQVSPFSPCKTYAVLTPVPAALFESPENGDTSSGIEVSNDSSSSPDKVPQASSSTPDKKYTSETMVPEASSSSPETPAIPGRRKRKLCVTQLAVASSPSPKKKNKSGNVDKSKE